MNVIIIDPRERTIKQVTVKGESHEWLAEVISCNMFCIGSYIGQEGDAVFVDDEGLLYEDLPTYFFKIDGRVLQSSNPQMLAGKAVLMGCDESTGESQSPVTSVEQLTEAVRWCGIGFTRCTRTGITVDLKEFGAAI